MGDWLKILPKLNLTDTDPESKRLGGFSPSYKKEVIARNEENEIFRNFLADLTKKYKANKKAISDAYGKDYPFPELIEVPETKNRLIERRNIWSFIEKYENKELYYTLLKNNNQPNYQDLVWNMSHERRRDNVFIPLDFHKNEHELFHIFQSAIMLCPPANIQSDFQYFAEQWSELDGIDSKKETEDKKNEILSEFHKAMRQTDMFGNGHASSIIYNLWHVSDIVYRAFIAVTEHLKEKEIKQEA